MQRFGKEKILVARLDGPQIAIFNVFWGQIPIFWMVRAYFANTQESKIEGGIHFCGQKFKNTVFHAQKAQKPCFIEFFGL